MKRRTAPTGPDLGESERWRSELAWWRSRCEVGSALDVDELRRYAALHESPADYAVDAIIACGLATSEVQRSVSDAAYSDARRLPGADRPLGR